MSPFREAAGEYVAICVMSYKLDVAKTIPTHTSDEAEAVGILLNACRSAVVGCICLSGQDPLGTRFLEQLVTYGPSMSAYSISFRKRRLADHVPKGLVLQAIGTLKNVGRISALPATEWKDENLEILRFCAEIGTPVKFSGDIGVSDDELLQFLFEGKETRMDIDVHSSQLSDQFFKRLLQARVYF
ncbi:hypothetical protein AAVH_13063 [Aphelenchoides avenae]|nr:hypothetical protein AAVH_13063 [Aphelenchus avenae]